MLQQSTTNSCTSPAKTQETIFSRVLVVGQRDRQASTTVTKRGTGVRHPVRMRACNVERLESKPTHMDEARRARFCHFAECLHARSMTQHPKFSCCATFNGKFSRPWGSLPNFTHALLTTHSKNSLVFDLLVKSSWPDLGTFQLPAGCSWLPNAFCYDDAGCEFSRVPQGLLGSLLILIFSRAFAHTYL